MTAKKKLRKQNKPPTRSALHSDLAELTLLACTIRHNAREMRNALDCMDRIADRLEANRARLKAQNAELCRGEAERKL
jgi:hypothetical protein